MRILFLFIVVVCSNLSLIAQKRVVKSISYNSNSLEVSTLGLDEIKIENGESDKVEVVLVAENASKQFVIFEEEEGKLLLRFQLQRLKPESSVFRKFITERLERGSAILRVPKNTSVKISGENCNVIVNADLKELSLDLLNSIIRLNKTPKQASFQFYAGNLFTKMSNQSIDVESNTGTISVDGQKRNTKSFKIVQKNAPNLRIRTIKGNIFLTSQ